MRKFNKLFYNLSFTDACIGVSSKSSRSTHLALWNVCPDNIIQIPVCCSPVCSSNSSSNFSHKKKKKMCCFLDVNESGWSAVVFSSSIERLRAERLQREAEERRRAAALLQQRNNKGKESGRELTERERPYNSAYFPELARKRQRRDRESWRDEILKSWAGVSLLRHLKDRCTWASVEASFGDVIVLIKLVRQILLLPQKVRGRVELRFCPCRVLLITSTRQMAASRGAQRKHSETWSEQLLQSRPAAPK